jgi:hypothetical protein
MLPMACSTTPSVPQVGHLLVGWVGAGTWTGMPGLYRDRAALVLQLHRQPRNRGPEAEQGEGLPAWRGGVSAYAPSGMPLEWSTGVIQIDDRAPGRSGPGPKRGETHMILGTMPAVAFTPPPGRGALRPWRESPADPASTHAARPGEEVVRVLWDEVAPRPPGGWPAGGTLLFLWPQLRGDSRLPAWAVRPDDPEDERTTWWNREDSKLSAALLQPLCAELVAFHSSRAGPVRLESQGGLEAARQCLRRLVDGALRLFRSGTARPTRLDGLAALVEGAEGNAQADLTLAFGAPPAAVLHARYDERCLWVWQSDQVREDFDRLLVAAGDGSRFIRSGMDWSRTGKGMPAPRPPVLRGR